jgi:hypothetical protein
MRRAVLVTLTTIAFGLASVPVGLAIGELLIVPATVLIGLAVAVASARAFSSASNVELSVAELVPAFADALILPCFLGVVWILIYWAAHGIATLAGGHAHTIGLAVSCGLLLFPATAFVGVTVRDAGRELYPDAVGSPSLFEATVTTQGRRLYIYAGLALLPPVAVALLVLVGVADVVGVVLAGGLLLYGFVLGGIARPAGLRGEPEVAGEAVPVGLARAFEAQGYQVIREPRTGTPAADPFLLEVDLFVHRAERAFVVQVKQSRAAFEPAEWTSAMSVVNAGRSLEASDLPHGVISVRPLLVLVDLCPDAHLEQLCETYSLTVLALQPLEANFSVLGETPGDDLTAVARRYLGDALGDAAAVSAAEPARQAAA